ncbi:MAG: DUF4230 domain-containing protein [Chloroflexi bacterium]|nr:DUF4230 domain-containing protein [Chloroflexota bacterium]
MDTERLLRRVVLPFAVLAVFIWVAFSVVSILRNAAADAISPVSQLTGELGTQVAQVLNPTPTILPDPITIVHDIRSLARLETIQYSVEKVVTAETGQEFLGVLFGDRLLFVAHGLVIAGVDLAELGPNDLWVESGVLFVRLPEAKIFIATLDNEKSYIYDRQVGFLTRGSTELETAARRIAEREIERAALEDGILEQARQNAENFLGRMLLQLGFPEVIFVDQLIDDIG